MNLLIVLLTGIGLGLIAGAAIFFEPHEPYKLEIFLASTLRSALVALLTGFSLQASSSWVAGIGFGLLYGFLFGMVIVLAKGGFKSKDAPFVVPVAAVQGALAGLIIVNYAF